MITDTADHRNLAYHTGDDIPDRLDYHRMALVVKGLHAAVMGLAEGVGSHPSASGVDDKGVGLAE